MMSPFMSSAPVGRERPTDRLTRSAPPIATAEERRKMPVFATAAMTRARLPLAAGRRSPGRVNPDRFNRDRFNHRPSAARISASFPYRPHPGADRPPS